MADKVNTMTTQEDILYRILDNIDAYIYVSDPETSEVLFINKQMSAMFGNQKIRGEKCWKVFQSGFTGPCDFCPNKQLLKDPDSTVIWEEHNTYTGLYFKNSDRLIPWLDGRLVHIQHSYNITDLKLAQEDLKKQVEWQRLLTELSMNFVSAGQFDDLISKSLEAVGHYMETDIVFIARNIEADKVFSLIYTLQNEQFMHSLEQHAEFPYSESDDVYRLMLSGKPLTIDENTIIKSKGFDMARQLGLNCMLLCPLIIQGKLFGMIGFSVTSKKKHFSELSATNAMVIANIIASGFEQNIISADLFEVQQTLRGILDTLPIAVFWKNTDNKITGCNQNFLDYCGVPYEKVAGKNELSLMQRDQAEKLLEMDREIIRSKQPVLGEEIELLLSGKQVWLRLYKSPVLTADGRVTSLLTAFEDITVAKNAELEMLMRDEQLELAVIAAERANSAKSEFLARMSHEIRTPMNAIIGMTSIAKNTKDLDRIVHCLSKIDSSSRHLLGIINDILDMAKIEADKLELCYDDFSLETLLIEIFNIVSVRADEKGQNLFVRFDKDIKTSYRGDALRLAQVITNLMTNAIKFSPENTNINLSVDVAENFDNETLLRFNVTDQGIGMTQEQLSKLFIPFEQADGGIARRFGGTGLGLSICKRIIEMMGGAFSVTSEPGSGSTFSFTVKLENISNKPRVQFSSKIRPEELRILVIDDSLDVLIFFNDLLSAYGIKMSTADNGYKAIDLVVEAEAENKPFNIIFVDWRMPGIDGLETARRITDASKTVTPFIILISIAELTTVEKKAHESGITRFLSKPLFPSTIIDTINETLDVSQRMTGETRTAVPDLSGKKLLVAEDIPVNAEILEALLEETHAKIEFAQNGSVAVDLFTAYPDKYDLIFMDIHMPVMDGFMATSKIRALDIPRARTIPIVAMTANVFKDDVEKCLAVGMNDHIPKPIDNKKLFEKLRHYLGGNKIKKEEENNMSINLSDYSTLLPYVDVAEGMGRIRDNKKLYIRLLKNFIDSPQINQLETALTGEANITAGAELAHAVKGMSANLSLKQVYNDALNLERCLKEGGDGHESLFKALKASYETTLNILKELIAKIERELLL